MRLYIRFYLALLGSLIAFALITGAAWHLSGTAGMRMPAGHSMVAVMLVFLLLALTIGAGAYPIVRRLSRRLERLQQAVEALGAGDLTVRVPMEGKDEVGQLALSFNQATERIEKLVGAHKTLLANASHELRTPLARIRLATELMKGSIDPQRRAGLEQDINELDVLIDEILLASRLEAMPEWHATEDIDVLALAAEECARFDDVLLSGEAVVVPGDSRLLRRLIRNLLENAQRHGKPPIELRVSEDRHMATIVVHDAGELLEGGDHDRLFEPFYRRPGTTYGVGAGLGLSLVRQIAQHHGGTANCVSTREAGNCFVVTLPASHDRDAIPATSFPTAKRV
ncbi:MAG TPA: HAMP domain-containing sensor histidine kinase [Dyella sp.]